MDHGADCINTGISTIAYMQIINAETFWCYLVLLMVFQIFFYITLEEYYMGSLDFPIINFVNEGTTGMFGILLIGVIFGNEFYSKELLYGFNFYQIFLSFSLLVIVIQVLVIFFKLFRKFKVLDVLWKNALFMFVNISFLLVILVTGDSVVQTHPKIIMYIYTILYSRVIIPIMIAHIFDSNFDQFHLFPVFISTVMIAISLVEKFVIDGESSSNSQMKMKSTSRSLTSLTSSSAAFLCFILFATSEVSSATSPKFSTSKF